MTLQPDTRLGPYRIVAFIGAGGMGEVYRAVDTRLDREVAIKVLSTSLSHDVDAQQRFEQEAHAAGVLNHPNILAIYDIGVEGNLRYIVSELLEGESLRARIREGPLSPRKAAEYGVQIAQGLAAAHDKGIAHRDLKPENLFITRDGHVKILDFGLAKLMRPRVPESPGDESPTARWTPTEPGRILGTVGYMAPEQVLGSSGDHRSDIFAFGVILFEMLTGRAAFRAPSAVETLNEILKSNPPELSELGIRAPSELDRVIQHCLEKKPDDRFQAARDLAFILGGMSGLSNQLSSPFYGRRARLRSFYKPLAISLVVIGVVAAIAAAAYMFGTRRGVRPPPSYERITFRSGSIRSARFSPDGESVFYAGRFAGNPVSIFSARADSPESRDLGVGQADLLAVSSTGQLAISLRRHPIGYLRDSGTLAQVPISGAAPREILDDVEAADWTPDGKALAVVRDVGGACRLEYPIGTTIAQAPQATGWISQPRFSPDGSHLAFVSHPFPNDDRGTVMVVDLASHQKTAISPEYDSISGVAWSARGNEVWCSADLGEPTGRAIVAANLRGTTRVVMSSAGWIWLHDIAADGRLLVSQQNLRGGIFIIEDDAKERDLSWLDYSVVRDFSKDGRMLLFSESGEAGGSIFGIYIRNTDGSPAVRLGEGTSEALSPDGRWVLSIPRVKKPAQIMMLPTGAGQPRAVTHDGIDHRNARFTPDGKSILFQGNTPGAPSRTWIQPIGGTPRPITPGPVTDMLVTPDGRHVLARNANGTFSMFSIDGGAPRSVPVLLPGDRPIQFTSDGGSVFVSSFGKIPAVLTKVDLATGTRTKWREVMPAEPAGLINVGPVWPTPDGKTMVYSYARLLSDLFIVRGVR